MKSLPRYVLAAIVASLLVVGCNPARPSDSPSSPGSAPVVAKVKRMVAGMQGRPVSGYRLMNVNNSERGNSEMAIMMHSGLVVTDHSNAYQPLLAEATPSAENGLWKVEADGKMTTTLKIRNGAAWHDGTPFTADDLVFTFKVNNDKDFPIFRNPAFTEIDRVEAPDKQTIVTYWKRPFIRADSMWSDTVATPLPKHILETAYNAGNKEAFLNLPYWTNEFVGTGPFKLKEWDAENARVLLVANNAFTLGRPKLDEIEIRTIPDVNVIVANLLSDTIDVVIGRTLTVDHVVQLRERKPDMLIELPMSSLLVVNPQLLYETNPAIIRNVNFRKGMLNAIDRQAMVDGIGYGLTPIAHGVVYPTVVEGKEAESAVARYDYDPRKSQQIWEGLGLTKGSDGFYRDQNGQPMKIEMRATNSEINTKTMYSVADSMQRAGLQIDQVVIPGQLVNDQEYRSKFPGLIINGGGGGPEQLETFHSSKVRVAETGYQGGNRAGYKNPDLDSLIDRYTTTIPFTPRMDLVRQMTKHITENLPQLPLFFDVWPAAASSRLVNASAAADGSQTYNIQQWDVKS